MRERLRETVVNGAQVPREHDDGRADHERAEEHGARSSDDVGQRAEGQTAHGAETCGAHDVQTDDAAAAVVGRGGLAESVDADVVRGDAETDEEGCDKRDPQRFGKAERDESDGGDGGDAGDEHGGAPERKIDGHHHASDERACAYRAEKPAERLGTAAENGGGKHGEQHAVAEAEQTEHCEQTEI